ncbi:MAG: hypothetical protein AABW80_03890 [Nanoarchaeota archaeon]
MKSKNGRMGDWAMFSIFLFFVIVIAGGIALGTSIFFGTGLNYGESEGADLYNAVSKCMEDKVLGVEEIKDADFYKTCMLDKEILFSYFTLRIEEKSAGRLINFGNAEACLFDVEKIPKNAPKCVGGKVENGKGEFIIIAGSRQK